LKNVAALLATSIREVDVCARYGGDEFSLILPHTASAAAQVVADRARKKLAEKRTSWPGEAANISFSVGIASTEDAGLKTADDLLEAADRALFEAKKSGRDRVVVARSGILAR
jgi:diguanylate cyclase (GGDEF)-like protein